MDLIVLRRCAVEEKSSYRRKFAWKGLDLLSVTAWMTRKRASISTPANRLDLPQNDTCIYRVSDLAPVQDAFRVRQC